MPRAPGGSHAGDKPRHNPLVEDYAPTAPLKQKAGKKRKARQDDGAGDGTTVDARASKQILKIGQELADEDDAERARAAPNPAFAFGTRAEAGQVGSGGTEKVPYDFEDEDDEEAWGDEDDEEQPGEEIDPSDQDIFNRFNPSNPDPSLDPNNLSFDPTSTQQQQPGQQGTDLTSLILSKIEAHEAIQGGGAGVDGGQNHRPAEDVDFEEDLPPLPEKVVQAYKTIGQLLSRQRSGPLPKPFKILPSLPQWQIPRLLDLTNPMDWSPYAHLASVRLFISMRPDVAQPYLTTIVLPRVRDDIAATKKLHVHLYQALKKALYKPACFFKGIIFPLLEDGTCTQTEARIVASVLSRVSVPVLHSAAALLRLCDIAAEQFSTRVDDGGASGPVNIFIRCLLDKKYALPYKVVDALVFHFIRFKAQEVPATGGGDAEDVAMGGSGVDASRQADETAQYKATVLWHQSLLAFAQRYRNDITEDQREALLDLVAVRGHKQIGPEVRRELLEGRGRGVAVPAEMATDGDDTMMAV